MLSKINMLPLSMLSKNKVKTEQATLKCLAIFNLLLFSFACPKEKDTRQLGLRLPSLHGIKALSCTTMKTGWWRYGMENLPIFF